MKILFVSGAYPSKTSHPMKLSLEELGYEVDEVFRWKREVSHYQDNRSFLEKVCEKVGFPLDVDRANKEIIKKTKEKKYDLLFVVKGNHIFPKTLRNIKNRHPEVKFVNWSLDDMYAKHNRSNFYRYNLKMYDLVVSTKSYNLDHNELPSLGANSILFQNNSTYYYDFIEDIKRGEKFEYDVSFFGTAEKERFDSMNFLAKNGIAVTVFGSGWEKPMYSDVSSNLHINCKNLEGKGYFDAICSSKISLCFLRKINRDKQTLRTVEIPSVGGFMLAEHSQEQLEMFRDTIEASFFRNDQELLEKVNFYLRESVIREDIARNGKIRAKNFDMVKNAQEIIKIVMSRDTNQ